MTKPHLLVIGQFPQWFIDALSETYALHPIPAPRLERGQLSIDPAEITAMVTGGGTGASAELMSALASLRIVSVFGVGYDAVDVEHARANGISVTNTPGVLNDDVADLGLGLLLAAARLIPQGDAFVRSGRWANGNMPLATKVSGKRVGFVGMGGIGQALAERLTALHCAISYFSRSAKPELPYRFEPDLVALAGSVDFLIIIVSGGAGTRGLVSRQVIHALGPDGILVNISRGTTVDEPALLEALETGAIRAAGLDVFLNEPRIDSRFLALRNVVLQPHVGSATDETRRAMGQAVQDNLAAFFAGRPLPHKVV